MQIDHPQEEFKNDAVRVVVQKKPLCQVEFQVFAAKELVQKARQAAIKAVVKDAEVSGFRKGKAPEAMVVKQFGGSIEKKFHKVLGDLAFQEAQGLAKIPVLNQSSRISFEVKKITDDAAELAFAFETEPVVPPLPLSRFSPKPVDKKSVGDKEVDEAIRQMSFFYAKWHPVEDRSIREGDFVVIDLDAIEGDEARRVFDQIRFEVVPSRMANWMRKLVLNAKVGDVLEGMSEPDDTATDEEKQEFKSKKVRLFVRKVESPELPELDDTFAQKVGAPDVVSMREMVKGVLLGQVETHEKDQLREQVNRFLVSQCMFALPRSLLEAEYQHRFAQADKDYEFRRNYAKMSETQKQEIQQRIFNEAEQSLRLFYIAKEIVRKEKIPVTHQEIHDRAIEHRKAQAMGADVDGQISQQEYAFALSLVFLAKVQDFMLANEAPVKVIS